MTDYEGLRARKLQQQLTNMERRAIKAEKGVALERNRSNNYLTKIVALLNRNEELERRYADLKEEFDALRLRMDGLDK